MKTKKLRLTLLKDRLGISRLEKTSPTPVWARNKGLISITRTEEELSIVCPQKNIPSDVIQRKQKRQKNDAIYIFHPCFISSMIICLSFSLS
ncbi:hypothetical protein [Methanococcoides sp. NM1]|uniref:hypothetical protein n=1 Tax=Methanococcoides sp. NM1 TaxID=1201013 RepID=UPI00352A2841